jgi:hypothetical protein
VDETTQIKKQIVEKHRIKFYRTTEQLILNSAAAPYRNQMGAEIKHACPR